MKKIKLLAFVAALVLALPVMAQAQQSEKETRVYSYDSNNDGYIQPEEFKTYIYTRSDLNGDGYLADEEWKVSTSQWYRTYKDVNYNTYTYWDRDKDGRLDANENATLVEKTGLYSKWDSNKDGKVSNTEFAKGTFSAYDNDNNGTLNLEEWKKVVQ